MAIGSAFRTVHEGANKYLSNTAVVEIYKVGYEMVQDYQTYWKPPQSSYQKSLHHQRWNLINTTSLIPKEICLRHTIPAIMMLATHVASSKPALNLFNCMMLHLIGRLKSTLFSCKWSPMMMMIISSKYHILWRKCLVGWVGKIFVKS